MTPGDLIGRTIVDEQGRTYRYTKFFRIGGSDAKQRVQKEGNWMKTNKEIRNYRVCKYENVRVRAMPDGHYERSSIYALYTR